MDAKERKTQEAKVIRSVQNKDGKLEYECRICKRKLTDAVLIHGPHAAESIHRAHHYMEARDRVVKYAEQCHAFTQENKGKADMTSYMLLIGAVKDMKDLDNGK